MQQVRLLDSTLVSYLRLYHKFVRFKGVLLLTFGSISEKRYRPVPLQVKPSRLKRVIKLLADVLVRNLGRRIGLIVSYKYVDP